MPNHVENKNYYYWNNNVIYPKEANEAKAFKALTWRWFYKRIKKILYT